MGDDKTKLSSYKVWNGLFYGSYDFIVSLRPNPSSKTVHQKWVAIYDVEKRKNSLDYHSPEWQRNLNKKDHSFLYIEGAMYAFIEFESTKVKEEYVEEQFPDIINKSVLHFNDLGGLLSYLESRDISLDAFEPPHTTIYPLNHTNWGEHN